MDLISRPPLLEADHCATSSAFLIGVCLLVFRHPYLHGDPAVLPPVLDGRATGRMECILLDFCCSTKVINFITNINRSYVVLASRYIDPGSPFRVVVTLFRTTRRSSSTLSQFFNLPSTIFVRILRQGQML